MAFETPQSTAEMPETDVAVVAPVSRNYLDKKIKVKVPRKIHKAEREKLKREHLNDLFLDLANALELTEQNNGKASILCEASRVLKDLVAQIECLRKENASLLSESQYVDIEKNELREETSTLASQIEKLRNELQSRAVQSKPDLNIHSHFELQRPEALPNFSGECIGLPVAEPPMPQAPAVFIVPMQQPDLAGYPTKDGTTMRTALVSKPQARYLTPSDSWPSELLKLSRPGEELPGSGCKSIAAMGERDPDRSES